MQQARLLLQVQLWGGTFWLNCCQHHASAVVPLSATAGSYDLYDCNATSDSTLLLLLLLLLVLACPAVAADQQSQLPHQQWCAFGTDVAGTNL
jgi:hypothetical protein